MNEELAHYIDMNHLKNEARYTRELSGKDLVDIKSSDPTDLGMYKNVTDFNPDELYTTYWTGSFFLIT